MKVVGINGSPRREGNTSIIIKAVFKELEKNGIETELIQLGGLPIRSCMSFLHYAQTFLVGASYWNMVYGKEPGDVERDEEGMKNMQVLGENMAWLLKRINN